MRFISTVNPRPLRGLLAVAVTWWACCWSCAIGQVPLPAPGGPSPGAQEVDPANRIAEVRIDGNDATDASKLPKLITRAGQIFDPQSIEEDVRTLHRSRKFIDVQPKYVRVREGVVVIFQVVERPMIRYVKYIGNERVTTRTLRKKAEIDVGDSMDAYVVEEARRRLESYYHEKGYDAARVTAVEGGKPGDKGAVFLIDEGRSKKALWTNFVGNTIANDARLLTQIKSKPGVLWLLGGDIDREKIDADVDALTAYYRSLGFFQAKVGRELDVVKGAGRDWTRLTFVINEGPRYAVRSVSFIGNTKFKEEFLARDLELKSGEPFNQSKMEKDLNLVRDIYGGRGFVFADIRADPRFLQEPGQLDLVYNITEGRRYRVGQINVRIRGEHPHTRHATILNRLSLRPGDILDIRKLRNDERRIKSSGLFLADAAKGEGPKIVFNKPEDADEQLASGPGRGFRGQSPDGEEDAVLNLVLEGELIEPRLAEPASAPQSPKKTEPPSEGSNRVIWRGQSPQPAVPAPPQPMQQAAGQPPWPQQLQQPPSQPMQSGAFQQPWPQPPQQPAQPQFQQPVQQRWGGGGQAPGAPAAVTYSQTVAPQQPPPVRVAQLPAPGQVEPPGGMSPAMGFGGGMPPAPGQPGGFGQPGMVQDFGQPGQVFPGNDPYVDLDAVAEETQTGRLMIGAGVNSNAGLVGNIVIDEQNFDITRLPRSWDDIRNGTAFRGAGQRFRLEAAPGTQLQRYTATFQEPYLFDTRIGLSTSASYFTRFFSDWAENRLGGRVGLGYQFAFAPDLSVNTGFRGENVDIYNPRSLAPAILNMLGNNAVYGFSGGIVHDTRDSPFLPTQGHLATFEFEQVIGTFVYPRGILEGRQYFLMNERPDGSGRHVLSIGSVLGMSGPDTPAYDNFFAGGYNTIRGFAFRGASPLQDGAIIGGPFQWLNTVEYMFPITADDTLRGVVFTDFGTVEPIVTINQMRVAPGFGLRITLPAMGPAPIALDFAFPVAYAQGDTRQIFSFFVGFAR